MNRAFLGRVVHFLAAERGIRQFLDIGSGLPTASNVHEIAQAADPDARVVYVDNDPVVVLHAQAILEDRAKGVAAVRGDLRDPAGITASPAVRGLIDFSQPVAVLLFAVLHFVPDADDPRGLLARFSDVMAPGSALALSHITDENIDEEAAQAGRAVYQSASAPIVPRSRAQIEDFFNGVDLLPPGVADISQWPLPDPGGAAMHFYGGVAVKPAKLPVAPRSRQATRRPRHDHPRPQHDHPRPRHDHPRGRCGRGPGGGVERLRVLVGIGEGDLQGPLVGAAHDPQLEGAAPRRREGVEQVIGRADGPACGRHDQVA
jgi:hypothetical protein